MQGMNWEATLFAEFVEKQIVDALGIPISSSDQYGSFSQYGIASYTHGGWSTSDVQSAVDEHGGWVAYLRHLKRQLDEALRRGAFVDLAAPEIERRLPADFTQGRDKLARALAEAEYDFAGQLAHWAQKHHVPLRL